MAKRGLRTERSADPPHQTVAAISLVSDREGTVTVGLNAKAAEGTELQVAAMEWGDLERETVALPMPVLAVHAYVRSGPYLAIFTVTDTAGATVSVGLNVLVGEKPDVVPPQPEPAALDMPPPPEQGQLLYERTWQYQGVSAPLFVVKPKLTLETP